MTTALFCQTLSPPSNVSFLYQWTYFLIARSAGVCVCVSRAHSSGGFSLSSGRTSLAEERRGLLFTAEWASARDAAPDEKKEKHPAEILQNGE